MTPRPSTAATLLLASLFTACAPPDDLPDPDGTTQRERVVVLSPNGDETFHLGDTVRVSFEYRFSADTSHFVTLWFSPDRGLTLEATLYPRSFIFAGQRKDTAWVIPRDDYYLSDSAVIRVEDYERRALIYDLSDAPFRIVP